MSISVYGYRLPGGQEKVMAEAYEPQIFDEGTLTEGVIFSSFLETGRPLIMRKKRQIETFPDDIVR